MKLFTDIRGQCLSVCFHGLKQLDRECFEVLVTATESLTVDEVADAVDQGTTADADAETTLLAYNVNQFAYDTIVPDLLEEVRTHVEDTAKSFQDSMEHLSFMPNSPTLMNAGDEFQQFSACFVVSEPTETTS